MKRTFRGGRRAWLPAIGVLTAGIITTAVATVVVVQSWSESRSRRLDLDVIGLSNDLRSVVAGHTAILSAMRSLHLATGGVSEEQFRRFVSEGALLEQYPGAQAFEFARRIRATGGARHDQWVVEYVEPLAGNEVVRGLDLAAETVRRRTIEAACAADRPMATDPVRLVQERAGSLGVVVFGPVYDRRPLPSSPAERQQACSGLMIVVYRAHDLLSGVRARNPGLDFELYDLGPVEPVAGQGPLSAGTELFDVDDRAEGPGKAVRRAVVDVHGRRWQIALTSGSREIAGLPARLVGVPAAGLFFSAVAAGLVLRLSTFRRRALARGQLVAAGDRDRRSLERDLHDGAQQRLLSVALMLARSRSRLPAGSDAEPLLGKASEELDRSLQELRDLAAGLHPAVLSDHSLAVAAEGVAARAPVPVDLRFDVSRRHPHNVEAAAYFVLCEAVTNATKHARATRIVATVRQARRRLCVEVCDDGVGLSPSHSNGSGLRGLADRVEALDGRLRVTSRPGRGTCVRATIPCG